MLKNNKGFTLIEMLVVLMVISVLIILIVPNLNSNSKHINETGCEALRSVVQAQVDAYYLEENEYPENLNELVDEYITDEQLKCPNGEELELNNNKVTLSSAS